MLKHLHLGLALCAALLVFAAPALAAKLTLTGDVTYRERIALPAAGTLRVRLIDLATPDQARVEAEAAIANPGQVPLTFTLNLDETIVQPGHSYGLVAEIVADGAIWFRNVEPYPVDPLAPASPILIVVTFAGKIVDKTDIPAAPPPPPILDVTWQAESIGGTPVVGSAPATLSIAGDMRAGGRGGCNSWFAQAKIDGDAIAFSAVAATRMSCAAGITEQETAFFAALGATRFWRLRDDKLVLVDSAGLDLVAFAKSAR